MASTSRAFARPQSARETSLLAWPLRAYACGLETGEPEREAATQTLVAHWHWCSWTDCGFGLANLKTRTSRARRLGTQGVMGDSQLVTG